jgi:hypothetical protein
VRIGIYGLKLCMLPLLQTQTCTAALLPVLLLLWHGAMQGREYGDALVLRGLV